MRRSNNKNGYTDLLKEGTKVSLAAGASWTKDPTPDFNNN